MTTSSSQTDLKQQRICLFGGTFDPVHLGHSYIARAAIRELHLDELIFLPCRQSPHKTGKKHASGEHRLNMCRMAIEGVPSVSVDDHDLTATEPSYSWRTAEHMKKRFPDARLFWLMGTDQWQALPRWNRAEHLADLVEFIVFTRGDEPEPRKGFRLHSIQGDHPASASAIRKAILQGEESHVKEWLNPAVLDYIHLHQLYLNNTATPEAGS